VRTQKFSHIFLIVLSVLLFGSCAEQGPSGPAGADGDGLVVASFQDGVYPTAAYAGTMNARLAHGSMDTNNTSYFSAGILSVSSYWRQLVKFDVSSMSGTGLAVKKAYITFSVDEADGATTITAYALSTDWVENQVTWNSYSTGNSWTTPGGDFGNSASSSLTVGQAGTFSLEISASLVQSWIDSPALNYGLLIKASNETTPLNRFHAFVRTDLPVSVRPRLTVYYTAP